MSGGKALALCMIARNEVQSIIHSMESVRNLVNEIVIGIDPTTTDNTKRVVEEWLKAWDASGEKWKVIDGLSVEEVGFAEARNVAIEQVTSEWILQLDADEVMPERMTVQMPGEGGRWTDRTFMPHQMLRSVLNSVQPELDLIAIPLVMLDNDGVFTSWFLGERLYRRHVRFDAPMHNFCINVKQGATGPQDLAIFHSRRYRPEAERAQRAEQRVRMAEKWLMPRYEKDPSDTRSMFYAAGTLNDAKRYPEAAAIYEKYLAAKGNFPHEQYQAAVFYCRALLSLKNRTDEDLQKAKEVAHTHIVDNWERAELYAILGDISFEMHRYDEAIWWYGVAARRPLKMDPHFTEGATHSWLPWLRMAQAWVAKGNLEEANAALKQAHETGAPDGSIDAVHKTAVPIYPPTRRIAVFIDRNDRKFIDPILDLWKKRYQIAICDNVEDVPRVMEWGPDVCWFEWAGPLLVAATKLPRQCRMVVRVHGYELHSGYLPQVNWERVDHVIFVAKYLLDMALQQVPRLRDMCSVHLIPGGVDVSKWVVSEGKTGNKIAMAGYINHKKNIPLALMALYEARATRDDLELHVAGDVQESREWQYIQQMIDELGLRDCVKFYPWTNDLCAWYADKDYFFSASREESFHYALAEAMACGLKPVIHCWRSSRDFYDDQWIFRTTEEAALMLQDEPTADDRQEYRAWIADKLSFEGMMKDISLIMTHPTIAIPAPDGAPWRFEMAVSEAADTMGFSPGTPEQADIMLLCSGSMQILNVPRPKKPQVRILWHTEHLEGDSEHAKAVRSKLEPHIGKPDWIVVSSPNMVRVVKDMGAKNVRCVYAGGARRHWHKSQPKEKSFDVGFYGVINDRRKGILDRLNERLEEAGKQKVGIINAYDPAVLADFVHRCRILLNLHIADEPNVESRLAEGMAAGTFVLTEGLPEGHPFPDGTFGVGHGEDELFESLTYYLEHEEEREEKAARGCEWIWENMTIGHQVDAVLEACGVRWLGVESDAKDDQA